MPRKSRFGYIFAGNGPNEKSLARTLAHELGHGLFTLQHSFDDEYGGKKSKGDTSNLMDYTDRDEAVQLATFQWNVIANPAPFTALDKKNEGEVVRLEALVDAWNNGVTPLGKIIKSVQAVDNSNTAILGISSNSPFVESIVLFHGKQRVNSYNWDKIGQTYISPSGSKIEDATDIVLTYNAEPRVHSARLYRLVSGEKCVYT